MNRLRLHQELFLFAHDDEGERLIHQPALCLGLAGAAVLDLILAENLIVRDGRVMVSGHQFLSDPVTDSLSAAIRATREQRQLGWWIQGIAGGIYDRTAGGLLAAGILSRTTRRGLVRKQDRLRPTDPAHTGRARGAVRYALYGRMTPNDHEAALCGLVAVLRLERQLYLDMPTKDILLTLRRISERHSPNCTPVLTAVEALIGESAVRVYR